MNKIKVIKDTVIPAGTVMFTSARKTERHGEGHFTATIGLSTDTSGDFTYCITDMPEPNDYFAVVNCDE
jgi:hypothetical protein